MSEDIVKRLRECNTTVGYEKPVVGALFLAAADEIERLRAALREIKTAGRWITACEIAHRALGEEE